MPEQKRGLGRGLAALLPGKEPGIHLVSLSEVATNPLQPRQQFDESALAELAASIRQHGILQPLVVTPLAPPLPSGERYRLVIGERRFRAARLAGLDRVPALVRELSSRESLEAALVENLQRQDLNPVEEAQALQELVAAFGLTQEDLASRVGKSRPAVTNSLRLLKLPEAVLAMLRDGSLSEGHARPLLALPGADMVIHVAHQVVEQGLSVRNTEALVQRLQKAAQASTVRTTKPVQRDNGQLEQRLRQHFGTKVSLMRGRRGGRLVIHFYSDDELEGIVRTIVGTGGDQ